MKHPALTRVFAIVLVLVCLTMALAGWLGLTRAGKDRDNVLYDMGRVRERAAEYRAVTESLAGRQSYDERSNALDERQRQHDRESSEHRVELSTYTATQYGINMGTQAMDAADQQFAAYKSMFEQGMAAYGQGIGQATELLGELWQVYNAAAAVLENANAHLAFAYGMAASLDAGEELTSGMVLAAYDELLHSADETAALYDTLHELSPTLDALADFDIEGLTALADGVPELSDSLGALGDLPLDAYRDTGVELPFDMAELRRIKDGYNQAWAGIKEAMEVFDSVLASTEELVQASTGMSLAEIRQQIQASRDELAGQEDETLDPALSAVILAVYNANSETIHIALDEAGARLTELNGYRDQAYGALTAMQSQFDALNALMAKAQQMIGEMAETLYYARVAIWYQMGQQRDKEEELRERKEHLDEEAEELEQLGEAAEEQKTLEQRQRSLRAMLVIRDEIRRRSDAGEELAKAAEVYADETEEAAETAFQARRRACMLMLIGAGCGLLGLPAAFEQIRSRFLLLAPVAGCLGCAAAAEVMFVRMGRGCSYSALVVAAFALIQLAISLPRRRKRKNGKHLAG